MALRYPARLPWDHVLPPLGEKFQGILSIFPKNLAFAFAYGSGVFKQDGHKSTEENMLDLIVVVDDPVAFHEENLNRNRSHYSHLKHLGPKTLASIQDRWAARVYFNSLVPHEGGFLKYGVVGTSSLETDLLDWEWLYISGRLHKPVLPLILPQNPAIRSALQINLQNAIHAALLLLPEAFSEEKLYHTLAGISYSGDFRMTIGEDRNKVKNIVQPQMERFRELYAPLWPGLSQWAEFNDVSGKCEQDTSPSARLYHLNLLPKKIQQTIVQEWCQERSWQDVEDVLRAACHDTECPEIVKEAIQKTVSSSSWSQSLKSIATAGIYKSIRYSVAKLRKMSQSIKRK